MSKGIVRAVKGGSGSGNWGHAGRPGLVGGSGGGAGMIMGAGQASGGKKGRAGRFLSEVVSELGASMYGDSAKWAMASTMDRQNRKYLIMEELSERSGVDEETVNRVIKQWAITSNDTDMRALSLQEAAAEELGLKLSDWQAEVIDYVRTEIAETSGYLRADQKPITSRANERAIIRAMYNSTQEQLAKAGHKPGDMLHLARGISYTEDNPPSWGKGDTINYNGNTMESWSVSEKVAKVFAIEYGLYGDVVTMAVPVSSIIGTARTGFGGLLEGEFVIAGSVPGSKATVARTFGY